MSADQHTHSTSILDRPGTCIVRARAGHERGPSEIELIRDDSDSAKERRGDRTSGNLYHPAPGKELRYNLRRDRRRSPFMRILHAISGIDPRNGGPTNALIGLAAAQVRAGLDVRVISTWQETDAHRSADRLESLGVGVRMVGKAHGKLSRHPALEKNLVAEVSQADVVHVHAMWEEIQHQACRVSQRLGKPYVFTPHGMLDPWNMRKSRLAKRFFLWLRMRKNLERAALLHYTTAIERDWVARMNLKPPTLVEPLGLDASQYRDLPPKGTFRAKCAGCEDGRPIILFLGRIHYGKGLELLVPALAKMKRQDATLVVAGPDFAGYRPTIDLLADVSHVAERIIYTGMIEGAEKLAALHDADLLAAPSYHENFGLAVIEALACGTPVVVSDQVNLHPDISAASVGGVVPLDADALARELDRWLDDESLRRAAASRAPAFVRERYDWDAIARRWVGHYERVLSKGAA
jgi:glycosyltransferase involved in cell wall biosynthesis